MTIRDRMVITDPEDPEGTKVAVLQRKFMALRATFRVYRFTPNKQGQTSTEKDAGAHHYISAHN